MRGIDQNNNARVVKMITFSDAADRHYGVKLHEQRKMLSIKGTVRLAQWGTAVQTAMDTTHFISSISMFDVLGKDQERQRHSWNHHCCCYSASPARSNNKTQEVNNNSESNPLWRYFLSSRSRCYFFVRFIPNLDINDHMIPAVEKPGTQPRQKKWPMKTW